MNGIGLMLTVFGLLLAWACFALYADHKYQQQRRDDRLLERSLGPQRPKDEIWSDFWDFWDANDPHSRRVPAVSMSAPVIELRPDVKKALEDLHRHLNPVT